MKIFFYNTLTKSKDEFKPLEGNEVRIYTCGPTVYKDATIGNMKSYIFMDTLRRVLKYNGYTLKHAMNITDVGHLVSDMTGSSGSKGRGMGIPSPLWCWTNDIITIKSE